ncbi:MAG: heavy metal translocating P-type ATPase metal-binding domain-containing protein [Cytophagales bacterium]|nr:heavy metal translocating P-type ATPase metal-binding domain-containing protein [Bernardetiaceae bacterium]MDW8203691.1 heavy metal translocating P-type ATPase metal-binding domain-containing protein [Cytophagales bacterium]
MEPLSLEPKKATATAEKESCYHCGETCEATPILIDEHPFCCQGCATVYELLRDNEMCQYYDIANKPGANGRQRNKQTYQFLDDEKVAAQLLDFAEGTTAKVRFFVPAIHCASCIWLLENLQRLDAGVLQSRVNFMKREVSVTFNREQTSLRQVAELLASLNYPPLITLEDSDKQQKPTTDRSLIYKAGVAFFCFGNMMLISLPEYLTFGDYVEENFRQFFGYLNILLALPVLLYCSQDYFISSWHAFRQRQMNIDVPITLGIICLFGVSAWEILSGTGAGYMDSLGGLLFFLLTGRLFQQKTYQALSFERDYKSYFPISITLKKDGAERFVQVSELKKGDRIMVRHQELIPADAILRSGEGLIDYSFVTGEAEPVVKKENELIYAGGRQVGGAIELEVVKDFSQSYLTQLWNNEIFSKNRHTRIQQVTDRFSKTFTTNVLVVAFAAALYWLPQDTTTALRAFTSVLIIACPCAIALAAPYALGTALRYFGRHQFYLKNTQVIEQLAAADTLVFDKTGTLTNTHEAEVTWEGAPLSAEEQAQIAALAAQSTHPLSKAIARFLGKGQAVALQAVQEYAGKGIEGYVGNHRLRIGSAAFAGAAAESSDTRSGVHVSFNEALRGKFIVQNRFREDLDDMLAQVVPNYKVAVLSGDGEQERPRLEKLFAQVQKQGQASIPMLFHQSPHDKLAFLKSLQEAGSHPVMLGDGLNDAGALRQADVGIALAEDVLAFSPASDGILDARAFPKLPQFLHFSKQAVWVVKACFALSLCYNAVGLSFAVRGDLSPVIAAILMPLSSVSVVAFATLMTRYKASQLLR